MNTVDRRTLLKFFGALGISSVMAADLLACSSRRSTPASALLRTPTIEPWAALADRGPEPGPVLVAVRLPGGNDGLDTVVPYGDSAYEGTRRHLAHRPDRLLRLDGRFGLHPALPHLAARWAAGQLAVVHGVHHMLPDLSHFHSADLWSTGTRDSTTTSGWLGRSMDALGDGKPNPLWAVAVGASVPTIMNGEAQSAAAIPVLPDGFLWNAEGRNEEAGLVQSLGGLANAQPVTSEASHLVQVGQRMALTVCETAGPLLREEQEDGVAAQLRLVAAFIRAGCGTRIYHVTHGGDFDVHSQQQDRQPRLLSELDQALDAFLGDLGPAADRVVVMTWSEFGRRAEPNGSGTDHGTASTQLVLGSAVRGGHYGEPARLDDLDDDGNPKATTDFRAVAATLVERWLHIDAAQVLPGVSSRLSLV